MVQYVQADVLANLCAEPIDPNLGTLLVEVVASVLDNEVSHSFLMTAKDFTFKLVNKRIQCFEIEIDDEKLNHNRDSVTMFNHVKQQKEITKFNQLNFSLTTKTFAD